MNKNKKNILIVYPEGFALGWRGATSRLIDLSFGLNKFDWNVSMICAKYWGCKNQIEQEKKFNGKIFRTDYSGDYPRIINSFDLTKRIWRGVWRVRGSNFYYKKLGSGWARRLENDINNIKLKKPDIVWAICTSNMNGIIAGRIIANFYKSKLVLEFQDPPSSHKEKLIKDLEFELINSIKISDGIVTTSESFKKYIVDKYSYPEYKISTIYLTYNDELINNCAQTQSSGQLVLLHAGSLKTGDRRNARSIINAISLVYKKRPDIKDKIKFWMIGGGEGAEEVVLIAEKMKISSSVKNTFEMPSDYIAKIMNEIDVNVVIKHDSKAFDMQIPGKLFQCIGYKKPVLGIMSEKTEAASILKKTGLGIICENSDIEKISSKLIYLYDNRDNLNKKFNFDANYIQKFSVKNLGINCNKFLQKILLS